MTGPRTAGPVDAEKSPAAILKPLDGLKEYVNVITGMTLDKARANGDGPGDHARAQAAFLTGRQPRDRHDHLLHAPRLCAISHAAYTG